MKLNTCQTSDFMMWIWIIDDGDDHYRHRENHQPSRPSVVQRQNPDPRSGQWGPLGVAGRRSPQHIDLGFHCSWSNIRHCRFWVWKGQLAIWWNTLILHSVVNLIFCHHILIRLQIMMFVNQIRIPSPAEDSRLASGNANSSTKCIP